MGTNATKVHARRRFVYLREVSQRYDKDPSTVRRWWQTGVIPHPMRYGGQWAWPEHLLDEHDARKAAEAEAQQRAVLAAQQRRSDVALADAVGSSSGDAA